MEAPGRLCLPPPRAQTSRIWRRVSFSFQPSHACTWLQRRSRDLLKNRGWGDTLPARSVLCCQKSSAVASAPIIWADLRSAAESLEPPRGPGPPRLRQKAEAGEGGLSRAAHNCSREVGVPTPVTLTWGRCQELGVMLSSVSGKPDSSPGARREAWRPVGLKPQSW